MQVERVWEASDRLADCLLNCPMPWDSTQNTFLGVSEWDIAGVVWVVACFFTWRLACRVLRPKRIPWKLGPMTVDLIGGQDTIHAGLIGTSGKGKTSALIPLLSDTDKPVAAVGFDDSQPLHKWWEAHENDDRYIHWRMDGTLGWDILHGEPVYAAEGLTAGFERSAPDTGYFRGLAANRLMELIEEDDAAGRPRNMWRYVDQMNMGSPKGGDASRACRRWAGSFESLLKKLGPALGNDFNLTDAMKQGKRVLLMPNRFMMPESADLIGGIGLVQVRRAAAATGNFLVFIEEAGQARAYERDIDSLFQAGRTRGCPMILITQNASKLRDQVTNNIGVWVAFGQRTDREAEKAAELTRVEAENFIGLARGVCYVRVEESVAKKVKLPLVKPPRVRNQKVAVPVREVPQEGSEYQRKPVYALPAPKTQVFEYPKWVGANADAQRIYSRLVASAEPGLLWTPAKGFWRDGPCLLWDGGKTGGKNGEKKDLRPAVKVDGATTRVYKLTYVWSGRMIPPSYQVDHLCANPLCCEPNHLEAVTAEENIARRDGRKKALASFPARLAS